MTALFLVALALQSPVADGIKALDAGKPAEAEALFTKAILADPTDYGAFFNLAFAQSVLNKDAEATANYRKVLALKPGIYEAELNLGILLLRQKMPKDAAPLLEAAAKAKPDQYRPNYFLGEALLDTGQGIPAEAAYRAAILINPKSAEALQGLGQALLHQHKTAEGAVFIEQAAAIDPSYQPALLQLASVYEADKKFEEAIQIYRRFPNEPGTKERLGELLIETGKPASAIPELEAAVKESPSLANLTALATAYLQNKQPEKCQPVMDQALRLDPNNGELRLLYGRLLRDLRKFDLAANQFSLAVKLNPQAAEAWADLAMVTVMMERYDVALAALDKVKQLNAEKPGHKYLRAITLDKIRQNRQQAKLALSAYQDFLGVAAGKFPDEEFKARQRVKVLEREVNR